MIYINCDYNEGAHEKVLERVVMTNGEQTAGYCKDAYCAQAADLIRSRTYSPVPLLVAAVMYLIVVMIMTWGLKALERRLAKSDRR